MMEVCGGQTHSIIRHGIDQLLPDGDRADPRPRLPGLRDAAGDHRQGAGDRRRGPDVIFCSFGDMLRVPGQRARTCSGSRAPAATSASSTRRSTRCKLARENPDRQVVFFGIGFETTAPANAMTVYQAKRLGIANFSLLVSHVLVPPAIAAIMESPTCRVQAFLAAGHVCSVMGTARVPAAGRAVPGPDRGHRLRAAGHPRGHPAHRAASWRTGRHEVENAYPRAVPRRGQPGRAWRCCDDVFEVTDRAWRGIGDDPAAAAGGCSERTATSTPSTASRSTDIHTAGVGGLPSAARCCRG